MMTALTDSRDIRYVLFELLNIDRYCTYERFSSHDHALYEDTLTLAEKIAHKQLYPTNVEGDREGVHYDREQGTVTVPKRFHEAYRALTEAGFIGVAADPVFGGLGLPLAISVACKEFFCAGNGCLTFYTLLTGSAAQLIYTFGNDEQKRTFLPQMLSGHWTGTMCLTEPNAGST